MKIVICNCCCHVDHCKYVVGGGVVTKVERTCSPNPLLSCYAINSIQLN